MEPEWVGGEVVPIEHAARQRAVICQDCWFWREMSCALSNPDNGVCANRRPVRGRQARPAAPEQAQLMPLAAGHAAGQSTAPDPVAATIPFASSDPEATFSLAQVRAAESAARAEALRTVQAPVVAPSLAPRDVAAPPRVEPMRAAAATRAPGAELRVELDAEGRPATSDAQPMLPGIDQLVERVRRRTAARISRGAALTTA